MRNIKTILYISLTILLLAFITYTSGYRLSAVGLVHELDRKIGFTPSEVIYHEKSENELTPKMTIIVTQHDNWIECRSFEKSLGFLWNLARNEDPINTDLQDPSLTKDEILGNYISRCSGMPVPLRGSSSGNLNNGARFVESDSWVYAIFDLSDLNSVTGLYKMRPDGSDRTKISDSTYGINVAGGRIYTFNPMTSMKTDGTDEKSFIIGKIYQTNSLLIIDDTMIFNNFGDYDSNIGFLYARKTDGTGMKQLTRNPSKRVDFAKGWVYYVPSATPSLRRIRLDATEDMLISEDVGNDFMIFDETIYYVSQKNSSKLYKMDLNGENILKLTDYAVSSLNTDKTKIYYIDPSDKLIHSVKFDGTSASAVSLNKALNISIVTGYLYYSGIGDTPHYRINLTTHTEDNISKIIHVQPDPVETKVILGTGNSNMNLISRGSFAEKDGSIYFSGKLYGIENGIYRINPDGTGKVKIANVNGEYFNFAGNYLYFINNDDGKRIYRVSLVGTELQRITYDETFGMIVKDGWIYYFGDHLRIGYKGYGLMKIKTDGTGFAIIMKGTPLDYFPQIVGGTFYFIDKCCEGPSRGIYSIKSDGSGFHTYTDKQISSIVIENGWIYYTKSISNISEWPMEIHRVKTDGTSDSILLSVEKNIWVKGVADGYLYYTALSQKGGSLYRIKLDGTLNEVVIAEKVDNYVHQVFFLQGKLITVQGLFASNQGTLFISNPDGSGITPFLK